MMDTKAQPLALREDLALILPIHLGAIHLADQATAARDLRTQVSLQAQAGRVVHLHQNRAALPLVLQAEVAVHQGQESDKHLIIF